MISIYRSKRIWLDSTREVRFEPIADIAPCSSAAERGEAAENITPPLEMRPTKINIGKVSVPQGKNEIIQFDDLAVARYIRRSEDRSAGRADVLVHLLALPAMLGNGVGFWVALSLSCVLTLALYSATM